jgi:hypothetical protein
MAAVGELVRRRRGNGWSGRRCDARGAIHCGRAEFAVTYGQALAEGCSLLDGPARVRG